MKDVERSTASEDSKASPSKRLRVWLIVVSTVSALALAAGVPATLFATYMAAFAADDPSGSNSAVVGLLAGMWAAAAGFYVVVLAGTSVAWIAFRKRRSRLSFGMSMLAAAPILLIGLVAAAVVVTSFVWTASIKGVAPSVP